MLNVSASSAQLCILSLLVDIVSTHLQVSGHVLRSVEAWCCGNGVVMHVFGFPNFVCKHVTAG